MQAQGCSPEKPTVLPEYIFLHIGKSFLETLWWRFSFPFPFCQPEQDLAKYGILKIMFQEIAFLAVLEGKKKHHIDPSPAKQRKNPNDDGSQDRDLMQWKRTICKTEERDMSSRMPASAYWREEELRRSLVVSPSCGVRGRNMSPP